MTNGVIPDADGLVQGVVQIRFIVTVNTYTINEYRNCLATKGVVEAKAFWAPTHIVFLVLLIIIVTDDR